MWGQFTYQSGSVNWAGVPSVTAVSGRSRSSSKKSQILWWHLTLQDLWVTFATGGQFPNQSIVQLGWSPFSNTGSVSGNSRSWSKKSQNLQGQFTLPDLQFTYQSELVNSVGIPSVTPWISFWEFQKLIQKVPDFMGTFSPTRSMNYCTM